MKKLTLLLLLSLFAAGVHAQTGKIDLPDTCSVGGLSFGYPKNWEMTDKEIDDNENCYFLMLRNESTDGDFVIAWCPEDRVTPEKLTQMTSSIVLEERWGAVDLVLEKTRERMIPDPFTGQEMRALSTEYRYDKDGVRHDGGIAVFSKHDRLFVVVMNSATSTNSKNIRDCEAMLYSLEYLDE